MRVLSVIVLTYCFGCVILDNFDEEFKHRPPVNDSKIIAEGLVRQLISSTKLPGVIATETGGTRESYHRQTGTSQAGDKISQALLTDTHGADHSLACHRHTPTGSLKTRELAFTYLQPKRSASSRNGTRGKRTPGNGRQISKWQDHQRGTRSLFRIIPQHHVRKKRRTPLHLRRDLAQGYLTSTACERCTTTETALRYRTRMKTSNTDSPPLNNGRFARRDDPDYEEDDPVDTEETENEASDWDEWTEWSECSASCGCGRQVRWRHCVGNECMTGLKKAQIRTCHLRDCNSKSLLTWLGIKP